MEVYWIDQEGVLDEEDEGTLIGKITNPESIRDMKQMLNRVMLPNFSLN
jgi:hypothetical protein